MFADFIGVAGLWIAHNNQLVNAFSSVKRKGPLAYSIASFGAFMFCLTLPRLLGLPLISLCVRSEENASYSNLQGHLQRIPS